MDTRPQRRSAGETVGKYAKKSAVSQEIADSSCTLWQGLVQYHVENMQRRFAFYEIRYRNSAAYFHISLYLHVTPQTRMVTAFLKIATL